jgi:transposase-like protein
MISNNFKCHNCGSENIRKNGKDEYKSQRYFCKDCKVTRILKYKRQITEQRKAEIIKATQERISLRGAERTFGVTRQAIARWIKKSSK